MLEVDGNALLAQFGGLEQKDGRVGVAIVVHRNGALPYACLLVEVGRQHAHGKILGGRRLVALLREFHRNEPRHNRFGRLFQAQAHDEPLHLVALEARRELDVGVEVDLYRLHLRRRGNQRIGGDQFHHRRRGGAFGHRLGAARVGHGQCLLFFDALPAHKAVGQRGHHAGDRFQTQQRRLVRAHVKAGGVAQRRLQVTVDGLDLGACIRRQPVEQRLHGRANVIPRLREQTTAVEPAPDRIGGRVGGVEHGGQFAHALRCDAGVAARQRGAQAGPGFGAGCQLAQIDAGNGTHAWQGQGRTGEVVCGSLKALLVGAVGHAGQFGGEALAQRFKCGQGRTPRQIRPLQVERQHRPFEQHVIGIQLE